MNTTERKADVVPEPVDFIQTAIDLGKSALVRCSRADYFLTEKEKLTTNEAWERLQTSRDMVKAMRDENTALREALASIRDYSGDPNTPVQNSVKKSSIARAALARISGGAA